MTLSLRGALVLLIGVVLGLGLALSTSVWTALTTRQKQVVATDPTIESAAMIAEVIDRVRREYVDRVDDKRIVESAIRGIVVGTRPAFELSERRAVRSHPDHDFRQLHRHRPGRESRGRQGHRREPARRRARGACRHSARRRRRLGRRRAGRREGRQRGGRPHARRSRYARDARRRARRRGTSRCASH